jgi:excisionase family DNA binding protein
LTQADNLLTYRRPQKETGVDRVLTLRELANYLRVHPTTVYRLLKKNQLPAFKVGSDWRFNLELIDKWRQEAQRIAGAEDAGRPKRTMPTARAQPRRDVSVGVVRLECRLRFFPIRPIPHPAPPRH